MEDSTLRDHLALERTRLANERTLLAYVRTALALAAGGAALFQFFAGSEVVVGAAWMLIVGGGMTLGIGAYRFVAVRSRLRAS